MIKSIEEKQEKRIEIDLTGPEGNAFHLINYTNLLGKKLGWNKEAIRFVVDTMQMSDYDFLVEVFDYHFGDFVILYK